MKSKIKNISIVLFIIDAILLVVNTKNRDETLSIIPDLNYAKLFFYIGIVCLIIYLIIAKFKEALTIVIAMAIIFLGISMFYNLRLAKKNYDRIQCHKEISEYFQYFEYESCKKIKKKYEEDLIKGELKYFQDKYNSDLEFEERLREKYNIKLIGVSCTRFTSMDCYNDLVKEYIKKRPKG